MRCCIGLLAFASCSTPPRDYQPDIDSLRLQMATLEVRQSDLEDKLEGLESMTFSTREAVTRIASEISTPKKKPIKRRKSK